MAIFPQKPCAKCADPIHWRVKSGLCTICAIRHCPDCDKQLGPQNKTGRCHPCGNRHRWAESATLRANHAEGIRRKLADDPAYRERARKTLLRNAQKASLDPENVARRRANWFRIYDTILNTPEMRAKNRAAVKLAGQKQSDSKLAWCPEEYRDEYQRLYRSKRMTSAEAREYVLAKAANLAAIRSPGFRDAIYWLNRIAPVTLQEDGTYRYGNAFLSPAEVISRAKAKGWQEAMAA